MQIKRKSVFSFHRKALVALMHKSEIEEGLFYKEKGASCLVSRCGGKENAAVAAHRRRRILLCRILIII